MKIGLAGAHGTGKTTFFYQLPKDPYFSNYTFLGSASRRLADKLPLNTKATVQSQFAIILSMVAREIRWAGKDLVTERTPLDALAYTYYLNRHIYDGEFTKELTVAEDAVREVMTTYDNVCYFPVYWPIEDDGIRPTDEQYQRDISKYIMMYLTRFNIRPYVMQNEPVDRRAAHLVQWTKRKM